MPDTGPLVPETGLVHMASPGVTFLLCFQARLFLLMVCVAVGAVSYVLLCFHSCLWPCCQAPGQWDSPTASSILSFRGYSRVPDGKVCVVGMGQCWVWQGSSTHACLSFPFTKEGLGGCSAYSCCGRG